MNILLRLYHFFGSSRFAVLLIGSVASLVIIGTFLESKTDSHLYAAHFTYGNPFFALLLWGFFANILISALRRWPFRVRHIPFLITHFGLLMLLGGAIVKNYFGVQGNMGILEGGSSQLIMLPDSYSVRIEKKEDQTPKYYPLHKTWNGHFSPTIKTESDLSITLLDYVPHSQERLTSWIKNGYGHINGLSPFPVNEQIEKTGDFPELLKVRLQNRGDQIWNISAIRADHVEIIAKEAYLQNLKLFVIDPISEKIVLEGLLKDYLDKAIILDNRTLSINLDLGFTTIQGYEEPKLIVKNEKALKTIVPLDGPNALIAQGIFPYKFDLKRESPSLLLVEDSNGDALLFAFDRHGQVHAQLFRQDTLKSVLAYDQGFGGYAVQATIPFPSYPAGRQERELAVLNQIKKQLIKAVDEKAALSPPLKLFQNACTACNANFPESVVAFLDSWDKTTDWLYPETGILTDNLEHVFNHLKQENFPEEDVKALAWARTLCADWEKQCSSNSSLKLILKRQGWPIPNGFEQSKNSLEQFGLVVQQLLSISSKLPKPAILDETLSAKQKAHLLSAYLQAHNIHLQYILPVLTERLPELLALEHPSENAITLESLLLPAQRDFPPLKKMENNLPRIKLGLREGKNQDVISLVYDRHGHNLKWPALNGKYLVRFQPHFKEIPYQIRLRQARQINYANSQQPCSYEADLLIKDLRSGEIKEETISMNNVYETWDGYRFYLSSLSNADETAAKRVQIVINQDPAKYWLTYPGAVVLTLGIFLLFWFKRKFSAHS